MKAALSIIVASAAFFVPAAVLAQSPQPTITVVAEPPGDNCEFGGVKVTVTPADEPTPTPEPTEEPDPDPTPDPTEDPTEEPTEPPTARVSQAEPTVEYVCNGQPGAPGDPGDNGDNGEDGQDGDNGQDGMDGLDADSDTPGIQASRANTCKTAGTKKVRVPRRFKNGRTVVVTANSQRRHPRVKRRVVKVNLKRVPCGYYPVLVQKRGVRTYAVVLHLTSKRVTRSTVK